MAPAIWFAYLVVLVSTLKVGIGLVGGIWALASGTIGISVAAVIYPALILTFSTGAIFLLDGRRRDPRALYLGVCFLLIATSFSGGPTGNLRGFPILGAFVGSFRSLHPESFLPFFAWCFFSGFPRVRTLGPDRISWWGRTTSLVLGAGLFLVNLLLGFPWMSGRSSWLFVFDRGNTTGAYWLLLFGFALPALVYALVRVRKANVEENRRTNLLVFGFVVGSLPVILLVLASALSGTLHEAMRRPPWLFYSQAFVYAGLLSIPFTTVYAVLARGALNIRLVVRAAIRYVLARRTVTVLTLIPILAFLMILFLARDQTLATLVAGPSGWALLIAGSIGLLGHRFRGNALRSLDQRFFREQYDARAILGALVHGVRDVRNLEQLSGLLAGEIDRALHPRFVLLLTLNPVSRVFESLGMEVTSLPETSVIAGTLRGSGSPLKVPQFREQSEGTLSSFELHWILDSDAELLVPLLSGEGTMLGLILLGAKKSELPFSREDQRLLVDIAAASAETLARRLLPALDRRPGDGPQPDWPRGSVKPAAAQEGAYECVACGRIGPWGEGECPVCGSEMKEAPVPVSLRGVYRLETRIGRGGMGLVYRAFDTVLGRSVAIKTLLRVDEGLAARLRHEARAMASVAHPNLATIYGAETWKGQPLILVEYFAAGTLEGRLERGPLSEEDALELGILLGKGIGHLHELGMLHRDIKPSNIGLSDTRHPKLLDFGLVQFLDPKRAPLHTSHNPPRVQVPQPLRVDRIGESLDPTRTGRVRGTIPYLPPEVLAGHPPNAASDLWGLTVVLFESLSGVNPFMGPGGALRTIAPDLREYHPDCRPEVADFFARALSPHPERRPKTVRDFREGLHQLAGM